MFLLNFLGYLLSTLSVFLGLTNSSFASFDVPPGTWAVDRAQFLPEQSFVTTSITTCVAIGARHPQSGLLALTHLLYRESDSQRESLEMKKNLAEMIQQIRHSGINPQEMIWSIVGGASFPQAENIRMRQNYFGGLVENELKYLLGLARDRELLWEIKQTGGAGLTRSLTIYPDRVRVKVSRLNQSQL